MPILWSQQEAFLAVVRKEGSSDTKDEDGTNGGSSQITESQSKAGPKGASFPAQTANAIAGPSTVPKKQKQKHPTSLSAPPPPRFPQQTSATGLSRSKHRRQSGTGVRSISSSGQARQPVRKGKGKEKEQATPKSRSRSSNAFRMRSDKEPSPKTKDKMHSALAREVMQTRIPKIPWKPGTLHDEVPATPSTPSVSLPLTAIATMASNVQRGSSMSASVHLHVTSTMQPPNGFPFTQTQDEYDPSVSLGMSNQYPT
jgi:hypothetical protein